MDEIFYTILSSLDAHIPETSAYLKLRDAARKQVECLFSGDKPTDQPFWEFGTISFPYYRMGAISSLDLFGLDELIIFALYWINRSRYARVADIGANIGLHSLVLGRCGYFVRSYEPDPEHFARLLENLERNSALSIEPVQAAVSTRGGRTRFVRVLGNTTGSHLAGAKASYGDKEEFEVPLVDISCVYADSHLVKMDAEGHEAALLSKLDIQCAEAVDIVAEVGSEANAVAIYEDMQRKGINMFSQKTGWQRVDAVADMPMSHREGSLFVTVKEAVPW